MKNFIITLFIFIISLNAHICIAHEEQKDTKMNPEYKVLHCNNAGIGCIVRNNVLKYGLSDNNGNILLPFEFSNISIAKDGSSNFILVKNTKTGIADTKGNLVVPVDCSWIDKNLSSYKQNVIKNGKNYVFDAKNGKLEQK